MTGQEYRILHGDPAQWTDLEYEQFAQCAKPGDPRPARQVLAQLANHEPVNLPHTTAPQPAA